MANRTVQRLDDAKSCAVALSPDDDLDRLVDVNR